LAPKIRRWSLARLPRPLRALADASLQAAPTILDQASLAAIRWLPRGPAHGSQACSSPPSHKGCLWLGDSPPHPGACVTVAARDDRGAVSCADPVSLPENEPGPRHPGSTSFSALDALAHSSSARRYPPVVAGQYSKQRKLP
jgi:hypothetical protein